MFSLWARHLGGGGVSFLWVPELIISFSSIRKPLCDFLEKPIPQCDFPRGNGAEEFFTRFAAVEAARRAQARRNMKVVGLIASSLLSAGVAFMILRNKK